MSGAFADLPLCADLIDIELLDGLKELLGDELTQVLAQFYDLLAQQSAGMDRALLAAQAPVLRELAHSLKGSACNLGLQAVASTATDIELAARHGEWALAESELQRLHECAAHTAHYLQHWGFRRQSG